MSKRLRRLSSTKTAGRRPRAPEFCGMLLKDKTCTQTIGCTFYLSVLPAVAGMQLVFPWF
jgi:hypothetical protein